MMEWKWSYGGHYEKSCRLQKQQQQQQQQQPNQNSDSVQHNIAQMAQHQSLLSENDIWSLDDPMNNMGDKPLNKREDTYNKMSEREMIGQIGMSPFSNSNYINDVIVQENFLKPVSTSSGRENQSSD